MPVTVLGTFHKDCLISFLPQPFLHFIGGEAADGITYLDSAPFPVDFVSGSVVVFDTTLENMVIEDENGNLVADIYHLDGTTWTFAVPYVNCFIINAN